MSASLIGGLGSSAFRLAALRHRDIDGSDLALGVDLHGLHAGGKSRSLDEHLDLATARRALQIAEKIPARFAPVAVNAVTLARNVGTQVEFVAVAGAAESLLQTQSGAVDIVGGLASDALGCSVGKRDCAVAGPRSVKTGKWPRLSIAYRHQQHERSADPSSRDSLSEQPGTKQFHIHRLTLFGFMSTCPRCPRIKSFLIRSYCRAESSRCARCAMAPNTSPNCPRPNTMPAMEALLLVAEQD